MPRTKKTRAERSLDETLATIERLKKRHAELSGWLADARRDFQPQALTEPEKYSPPQVKAAEEARDYIVRAETELAQVEEGIRHAWSLAGGLTDGGDRLAGTDAELAAQADALTQRRRQLETLRGTFREDAHHAVDELLGFHRERLEALLASWPLGGAEVAEAASLWAFRDPEFVARLHDAVEGRPTSEFASMPRSSWQAEIDTLARQAERRRRELILRGEERRFAEVEADKAQAEVALAAVGVDEPKMGEK